MVAAGPALEKYAKLHPEDDFKVLVHGWESVFWSHPLLQSRTFSVNQKGTFDYFIKNNRVVCPEPYYVHGYYNQKLSLAQAFDEEINKTEDHSDLGPPRLYISSYEKNSIRRIIFEAKQQRNKSKVLVIQPYGSGMVPYPEKPFDNSYRSLDVDDYYKLIKKLNSKNKDLLIFYFGDMRFRHPGDDISVNVAQFNPDLRFYLSLIAECDYFVGCDSVGQHMARGLDKPGMVIMGSTSEINVSYPDFFHIFRNGKPFNYSPIRLTGLDCEFADRTNDGIMDFTDKQIDEMITVINKNLYD